MATRAETDTPTRVPLSRERVLLGAIALADESGIDALTMRNLAQSLGVEAMSLYYHVANKEALLDGVVEAIISEIEDATNGFEAPEDGKEWKAAIRDRILTARSTMMDHPWAPGIIESRTTIGPVIMRYFDALLGLLKEGGFSYDLAHHALHTFGSRALGFTQELFEPDGDTDPEEDVEAVMAQMADQLPYIVAMMTEISHDDPDSTLGWCDDQTEFTFGLDLILDGLEAIRNKS